METGGSFRSLDPFPSLLFGPRYDLCNVHQSTPEFSRVMIIRGLVLPLLLLVSFRTKKKGFINIVLRSRRI